MKIILDNKSKTNFNLIFLKGNTDADIKRSLNIIVINLNKKSLTEIECRRN